MTVYRELDTPATMRSDAAHVVAHLPSVATAPAYVDGYAAWPTDLPKREVSVSAAARRLSEAMGLNLD